MRSGHTEAAVDLCKLAGLPPVGVISELVNDDGTVMRGPQVAAFAEKHGLKQVSVADLIAYRQRKETLIERVDCFDIETPGGKAKAITYTLPWDPMQHLAIVFGDIRDGEDVPVRLHPEDVVDDVFGTSHRLRRHHEDASASSSAASSSICARARSAWRTTARKRPSATARTTRRRGAARTNGARSASARRSSRISASPRST